MGNLRSRLASCCTSTCEDLIVELKQGKLRGREYESVLTKTEYYAFLGIPYAKPPLGELRFQVSPHLCVVVIVCLSVPIYTLPAARRLAPDAIVSCSRRRVLNRRTYVRFFFFFCLFPVRHMCSPRNRPALGMVFTTPPPKEAYASKWTLYSKKSSSVPKTACI